MTDQGSQTTQAPTAEEVLDDLLRTIRDSLQLAGSVIRGETIERGEREVGFGIPAISDRLATARSIVENAAPLAERLHTLQKTRSGGARSF